MIPQTKNGIKIGNTVKDIITGQEGIVTALHMYTTGTEWVSCVIPGLDENSNPKGEFASESQQIELVSNEEFFGKIEFKTQFNFGDIVKETDSNRKGIVHSMAFFIHGCVRYSVKISGVYDNDGKQVFESYDPIYLELVTPTKPLKSKPTGGGPEKLSSSR